MLGLFALAREGDEAGSRVDETSNKHSLRSAFAGDILRHFVVQFIRPQHVAAVTVHTIKSLTTISYFITQIMLHRL